MPAPPRWPPKQPNFHTIAGFWVVVLRRRTPSGKVDRPNGFPSPKPFIWYQPQLSLFPTAFSMLLDYLPTRRQPNSISYRRSHKHIIVPRRSWPAATLGSPPNFGEGHRRLIAHVCVHPLVCLPAPVLVCWCLPTHILVRQVQPSQSIAWLGMSLLNPTRCNILIFWSEGRPKCDVKNL